MAWGSCLLLGVEAAFQVSRWKTSLADLGLSTMGWFVHRDLPFTDIMYWFRIHIIQTSLNQVHLDIHIGWICDVTEQRIHT